MSLWAFPTTGIHRQGYGPPQRIYPEKSPAEIRVIRWVERWSLSALDTSASVSYITCTIGIGNSIINKLSIMEKKRKIIIALRKAKTSIEKILEQVENEDTQCFPVIQQNLAVVGLLKSVNTLMLESHMAREMSRHAGSSSRHMKTLQEEILKIIKISQNK